MKIAIVHDWITAVAGSESCLKIIAEIYPEADVFTLVSDPKSLKKLFFFFKSCNGIEMQ